MTRLERDSHRITSYLLDEMTADERRAFEADLEKDEVLAREYQFQLKVINHLKLQPTEDEITGIPEEELDEAQRLIDKHLKKHPDDFEISDVERKQVADLLSPEKKKGGIGRILYPLLAGAAVIAALMIVLNLQNNVSYEKLYADYYEPMDEVAFVNRGSDNQSRFAFHEGLTHYIQKEYTEASTQFVLLSEEFPGFEETFLFHSLSLMGSENYEEAAVGFDAYIATFDVYIPEAKWYLALCYIKLELSNLAMPILLDLSVEEGAMGKDAKSLLKKIDR